MGATMKRQQGDMTLISWVIVLGTIAFFVTFAMRPFSNVPGIFRCCYRHGRDGKGNYNEQIDQVTSYDFIK